MLAINKIVLLLIFLIVLAISLYVIFGIAQPAAASIDLQNQLRMCCPEFRATGCEDTSVICSFETMESFGEIAFQLGMSGNGFELAKELCDCPHQ